MCVKIQYYKPKEYTVKKYNYKSARIKELLIASKEDGVSVREMVNQTECSAPSASTLLSNWVLSGHAKRSGKRGGYRYYYTGKEFIDSSSIRMGRLRHPNNLHEKIKKIIYDYGDDWFTSGDISQKIDTPERSLSYENTAICVWLKNLLGKGVLERRGEERSYEYRRIAEIPIYFSKGEISDLVFEVFRSNPRPLSIDDVTGMVQFRRQNVDVSIRNTTHRHYDEFKNAVKNVIGCWCRNGSLELIAGDGLHPTLYLLSPSVVSRPITRTIVKLKT